MTVIWGVLAVFFFTVGLLLVGAELGFFLGRRLKSQTEPESRSQISVIEGSLLGMMGLLLGFTFSMAVQRFDTRQTLVVSEANALGTVVLRSNFLPDIVRETLKPKFREYADARLGFFAAGSDEGLLKSAEQKTARLQADLWASACEEARLRPTPVAALYVSALNDLFDLGEARVAALDNLVPTSVWIVLYLVASLASGSLGFGAGLTGRRLTLQINFVPLLMAVILTLLFDLDHPRQGMIRVSQGSMLRLRAGLK